MGTHLITTRPPSRQLQLRNHSFYLPPHTTHIAQPLDVASFGVLKQCWDEQCHQYVANNPGKLLLDSNFQTCFACLGWSNDPTKHLCRLQGCRGVPSWFSNIYCSYSFQWCYWQSSTFLFTKVDVLSHSLRRRKNIFNKGLKRDMTFPMIPNIFHGSTFIILMKLSVFVNWLLILLKNLRVSKQHQMLRVSSAKVVCQNFFTPC